MKRSRFSYVKYDSHTMEVQQKLKAKFEEVEALVEDLIGIPPMQSPADLMPGNVARAKSLVLTNLEVAYMWTGKALRDLQIANSGCVNEQPERNNE